MKAASIRICCCMALSGLAFLFLVGCVSSPSVDQPVRRREFDYVPPTLPLFDEEASESNMGEQAANTSQVDAEVEEEAPQKSFFARIFSGGEDESDAVDIERVGDREEVSDKEQGAAGDQQPSENVYRIQTGDTIMITLSGSGGLSEQIETVVDDEGAVKLRFIGAVQAEGLTTTELEREIELEYTDRQKIYRAVTARAIIPNTFYFIGGEVRQPGRFPIIGRVTLSQAVVAAGNFTEWANEKKIFLVRNNERVELDFRNISRNPLQDVELLAGDVVTVTRSTF